MPQLLRLWWSWTSSDVTASAGRAVRLTPPKIRWSAACTAGDFEAYSAEQRGGPTRAAGPLECALGTDKALGESQLSRPMARAAPTPSTGVCALSMCRHPCTRALTRMLACDMRLCLGRLWDHSKQSFMSLFYPLPYYETDGQ